MLNYKEIKSPSRGSYKEKGSKFIAYTFPIYSKEQIKEKLKEIIALENTARHHCYAYILHPDKSDQRANDDGEPSSTAGKPILGQILSNDLTNILIVVARYFGGKKLGATGLINAYKTAAADAISQATIIKKTIKEKYEVSFKYAQMNNVMRIVKEHTLELLSTDFQIECKLIFAVEKNKKSAIVDAFKQNHELTIKYIKTI